MNQRIAFQTIYVRDRAAEKRAAIEAAEKAKPKKRGRPRRKEAK